MGRPARPNVPGSRPYTGYDGTAQGITGGLAQFIIEARRTSNGLLHNLGAYGVRPMRGKKSMSVHATGRAVDLGFSRKAGAGPQASAVERRRLAVEWVDRIVAAAAQLGVEAIIDYWPTPHGRGYFCDRNAWYDYRLRTVAGAPGGAWFHVEISPEFAHNASAVRRGFRAVFPEIPHEPHIPN